MKVYSGKHSGSPGPQSIKVRDTKDNITYLLKHIVKHSPTGMTWKYGGSGPADAALSILTDCLGEARAKRLYQSFKWDYVARWDNEFSITSDEIDAWAKEKELSI